MASPGPRDPRALTGRRDPPGPLALTGRSDRRESRVLTGSRVLLGRRARLDPSGRRVLAWLKSLL